MRGLTERQREVLDFIAQFSDDNAYAPTVREICEHFNISIRAVQDHVAALQKKGYLSVTRHRSRSMHVVNDTRKEKKQPTFFTVPIVISGEAPQLLDEENVSGFIYRSSSYFIPGRDYFAIRITDDSMIKAGIIEGDMAVAEKTDKCSDGEIAVVYYERQIMVRRIVYENSRICLKAESDDFPSVYCQQAKILGVLTEVSRSY